LKLTPAVRRALRNKKAVTGICILAVVLALIFAGPLLIPFSPEEMGAGLPLKRPSSAHPMGTDLFGRDLLVRVLVGGKISLGVSLTVTLFAVGIGTPIGLISGYYGGLIDTVVFRIIDVLFAFPWLLMGLTVGAILGPGSSTVIISLAIVYSPQVARLVRSSVLVTRELDYIAAARAVGGGDLYIMLRHVLPNSMAPLLVQSSLILGFGILAEAGISYLGLGIQPPTPSWGLLLADARNQITTSPYLSIFPGVAIVITVLGFNLLGDGMRDLLDPRMKDR
jgi:peptide/nickel transport system permease protein